MKKSKGRPKGLRPWSLGLILLVALGMGCGESHNSDAVAGVENLSSPQPLNQEVEDDFRAEDDSTIRARGAGQFPGRITQASTTASGTSANSTSYGASLSADGRYLAFTSRATNLTTQPNNAQYQIFRKDLETGEIVCVSAPGPYGPLGNNRSYQAHISDDGSKIAFTSRATNINGQAVPADIDQVYLARFLPTYPGGPTSDFHLELLTRSMMYWNQGSSGQNAVRDFAGNNYVAFRSQATDLSYEDQDNRWDIYLTDVTDSGNPYPQLWSRTPNNVKGNNNSTSPAFSEDGTWGYLTTVATNLVPGGTPRPALVFGHYGGVQQQPLRPGAKVYDVDLAEKDPTKLAVSVRNQANTGFEVYYDSLNYPGGGPVVDKKLSSECRQEDGFAISDDGRFVVFEDRDRAEFSDTDGLFDIYLYDALEDKFYWVSKDSPNTSHAYRPTISDDGTTIAWDQGSRVWVTGNPALGAIPPKTPQVVTTTATGTVSNGGWQGVMGPTISDDGRFLLFTSKATNLASGVTGGKYYLYRKDLYKGDITLVSRQNGSNTPAEAGSRSMMSGDGNKVVFESPRGDLGSPSIPTSGYYNIYSRDVSAGATSLLTSKGRILDMLPDWSPDLSHLVFQYYGSQNDYPQGVGPGIYESILEYFYPGPTYIQIPSYISQNYLLQTVKYSRDHRYLFASFSNPADPSNFLLYRFSGYSYYGNNEMLITDRLYYSDFDCSEDGETVAYVEKDPGVTYSQHVRIRKLTGWGSWDEPLPTQCSSVHMSFDGRYVLFYDSNMQQGANTGSGSNAYVYDTQTRVNLPLRTERVSYPGSLRMSGDGRSVIFSDAPGSNTQFYVVKNPHLDYDPSSGGGYHGGGYYP